MEKNSEMSPISRLLIETKKRKNFLTSFQRELYDEMVELENQKGIDENYLIVNDMHFNSINKRIASSSNSKVYNKVLKRRNHLVTRLCAMKKDFKQFKSLRKTLNEYMNQYNGIVQLCENIGNLENPPDLVHEGIDVIGISTRQLRRLLQAESESLAIVYIFVYP